VSNFPLAYQLSWLPRLLRPSLRGDRQNSLPANAALMSEPPTEARRLLFIGDISAVANRGTPEVDDRLRALMASADLVVGNCESPVVERGRRLLGTRHTMSPRFVASALEAAGIEPQRLVLSLANNHMLDQGVNGYAETREHLSRLGIATIGGSDDGHVRTIELDGLTVGFAAFTQWRNASKAAFAGRVTDLEDLLDDDAAPLQDSRASLLCVVVHWDYEFRHSPRPATRALAHDLAESGAGLIVGHHAHVLQPVERIRDALVAFGVGDFLGTALPRVRWPLRLGGILAVDISADAATKGEIAAYAMVPFARERAGRHERLVPLDAVAGRVGDLMRERFGQVFPSANGQLALRRFPHA